MEGKYTTRSRLPVESRTTGLVDSDSWGQKRQMSKTGAIRAVAFVAGPPILFMTRPSLNLAAVACLLVENLHLPCPWLP